MSDYMTPAEVSAEFAKARAKADQLHAHMMVVPQSVAASLPRDEARMVARLLRRELKAIFDKFYSDLDKAEKQLIHPTESEQ
jgi:hypothetical protein